MGMSISAAQAQAAVDAMIKATNDAFSDEGVVAESRNKTGGVRKHAYAHLEVPAGIWRKLAKWLRKEQGVDYCSMITGIHWPEKDEEWQVVVHLLRMAVTNPTDEPVVIDASKLSGADVPIEIEVRMSLASTREPSVPSVADIWVGADWNEKETWDLVGIDFEGHEGMRRVLLPHDTPTGYHPLQKQHKLRYHDFNEMYDDPQGFSRKPDDIGKVK
ncbi:MAG: NADH-quinone oxidoreductase subunit C [Candidatus Thalassarchaeaceae archaeon]|jgi:NADH:ubiquinone oxidoreductase subunit C|nr:NADH-quinone oxidoreductase subunit C [Candidatus Thalassarchaeaceae archaeon]